MAASMMETFKDSSEGRAFSEPVVIDTLDQARSEVRKSFMFACEVLAVHYHCDVKVTEDGNALTMETKGPDGLPKKVTIDVKAGEGQNTGLISISRKTETPGAAYNGSSGTKLVKPQHMAHELFSLPSEIYDGAGISNELYAGKGPGGSLNPDTVLVGPYGGAKPYDADEGKKRINSGALRP